jgi:hypothetical protein
VLQTETEEAMEKYVLEQNALDTEESKTRLGLDELARIGQDNHHTSTTIEIMVIIISAEIIEKMVIPFGATLLIQKRDMRNVIH